MKTTDALDDDAPLHPFHPLEALKPFKPLAWALVISAMVHVLGFTALHAGGAHANESPDDALAEPILQASLIPATLIESPTLTALTNSANRAIPGASAGLTMQAAPPSIAQAHTSPPAAAPELATSTPAPLPDPTTEAPQKSSDAQAPIPSNPTATTTLAPAESQTAAVIPPAAIITAPAPITGPSTPEPAQAVAYRLPNQLTVHFEANSRGVMGKSVMAWKKSTDVLTQTTQYEAQLSTTATVLFKTFEHRFKSSGVINDLGLAPLNVEEKRTNGSIIATTVEPDKNRAIISSQAGFLPYDPQAHDLVSLMVQLAILAQTQPQWQQAGTAHDFTVYRPSGIKRWRFQSFGLANIVLGEKQLQTIYVRRVAVGAQADYEDQYHFWLDLNHYGFPVKMRVVDAKNNVSDIQMVDWQES